MLSRIIDFESWRVLGAKPFRNSGAVVNDGTLNGVVDIQANTFTFRLILLELMSGIASLSRDTRIFQ